MRGEGTVGIRKPIEQGKHHPTKELNQHNQIGRRYKYQISTAKQFKQMLDI